MNIYARRPDIPETPIIGENWSKLVETDQFSRIIGISFPPVLE